MAVLDDAARAGSASGRLEAYFIRRSRSIARSACTAAIWTASGSCGATSPSNHCDTPLGLVERHERDGIGAAVRVLGPPDRASERFGEGATPGGIGARAGHLQ